MNALWKVGEFRSSHTPTETLLRLSVGVNDANFVLSSQAEAMDSMIVAMEKATGAMNEIVLRMHEAPAVKMSYAHKNDDPWRRQGKRRAGRPR